MTERSKSKWGSLGKVPNLVKGEEKIKVGERQLGYLEVSGGSDSSADYQSIRRIYPKESVGKADRRSGRSYL